MRWLLYLTGRLEIEEEVDNQQDKTVYRLKVYKLICGYYIYMYEWQASVDLGSTSTNVKYYLLEFLVAATTVILNLFKF